MSPRISADQRDEYMQARRDQILDAAIDVFSKRGFTAAAVEEIAAAAGIAKGTIYLYFKSKLSILKAIMTERSFAPRLADLISGNESLEFTLREIAAGYFQFMESRHPIVRMAIIDFIQYPEHAHIIYHESIHKGIQMLAGYLESRSAAGQIRPLENPYLTARTFLGLLMAQFFMQDIMGGKQFAPVAKEVWIEECVRIFMLSVGLPAPPPSAAVAPEKDIGEAGG